MLITHKLKGLNSESVVSLMWGYLNSESHNTLEI